MSKTNGSVMGFVAFLLLGFLSGVAVSHIAFTKHKKENLACYEGAGKKVQAEYYLHNTLIRVKYVREGAKLPSDAEALAEYSAYPRLDFSLCTITIPTPIYVLGDAAMDSMGHELLHCLSGDFHP